MALAESFEHGRQFARGYRLDAEVLVAAVLCPSRERFLRIQIDQEHPLVRGLRHDRKRGRKRAFAGTALLSD
jgi:hypothetical protein